ncbi:MAG: serine O-acetyltransferase [Paracoccaceae bacterium]
MSLPSEMEAPARLDPVWSRVRDEARAMAEREPLMAAMVHATVLRHESLEDALACRIAQKLASPDLSALAMQDVARDAMSGDKGVGAAARADLVAVYERDPACHGYLQPILFFKGFLAVQAYRVAHRLWRTDRRDLAYVFQMRASEMFSIDIHPNARVGRGIMIDHAHAIVIGETATLGDNCSLLHSVTLGGTGKEHGDRHPKVGNGVLIGAGAKILGNIKVGSCSRIAAGSVVLQDVPSCKTVAGVPAKVVGDAGCDQPSLSMDQRV